MKRLFFALVPLLFSWQQLSAQTSDQELLYFEVDKVQPYISLDQSDLRVAKTLTELNPRYPADWVETYLQVEVITLQSGIKKKTINQSATLSPEQKNDLLNADENTEIEVVVNYIPRNNLSRNESKEIRFSFRVRPSQDAYFPDGPTALREYLKEQAVQHIQEGTFTGYDLAAVQFTVDESGGITQVQLFQSSGDEKTDHLLLETIQDMPCWQPARLASGRPVTQKFAFTIGNHNNCMLNLLRIQRPF
jgi:TonB family protein